MTNDINSILATKRAWQNANKKENKEARDTLAIALSAGKYKQEDHLKFCNCDLCDARMNKKRSAWFAFLRKIGLLALMVVIYGCHTPAFAYTEQQATLAVIGEAEGESQAGKEAVACAIHYRGYLTGVYGLYAPRVVHHKYSANTYEMARRAVMMADDQEYCEGMVNGAQYWASTRVDQKWIHKMLAMGYVHTATYGNQAFFRKD